jgi:hypothetical protein
MLLQIESTKSLHLSGGLLMYLDDAIGSLPNLNVDIGESPTSSEYDYLRPLRRRCPLMQKRGQVFGRMLS